MLDQTDLVKHYKYNQINLISTYGMNEYSLKHCEDITRKILKANLNYQIKRKISILEYDLSAEYFINFK